MKVTYDPAVDVLRIILNNTPIEESDESKPGVILDYDKAGNVVGLEILDATRRTDNPQTMEYAIALPMNVVSTSTLARKKLPSRKTKPHTGLEKQTESRKIRFRS